MQEKADKKRKSANIDLDTPRNTFGTFIRLVKNLKQQRIKLIIVLVSLAIYTACYIYAPFYSATVVDSLWESIQLSLSQGLPLTITWDGCGRELMTMTMLYAGISTFYYLQTWLIADVAETLNLSLRRQISAKLNKLPLSFFDGSQPGELLSRATSDLDKISEVLQTGLLRLISSVFTVIGTLSFMFYFSPMLTGIFLVFMVVCMAVTQYVSRKNLIFASQRQQTIANLTSVAEESYTGRNIIRAFTHEEESMEKFWRATEENRKASLMADFVTNSVNPAIRMITRLGHVVIAVIAGGAMLQGRMSIGAAQAFFQYINQTAEPLTQASFMINSIQSALASAERTFEILDEKEEIPDAENPVQLSDAKGDIAFEHVSFGYTPDRLLMRDISFTAKRGQKIAVVGSTGAGKTTLINLLMRFYEVNGGTITLDGVSTSDMTRKALRQNFGMVLQDTWLFGGTIAENIAYGRPEATREEIVAAAKAAKVDFFIRTMPQQYDTIIDNEAGNLSIGQRQLITIARVFLFDPAVIILDEATSSVDTRTEAEIGKAMKKLMKGRTSFVIAHRLSTIRDADSILFMQNGNIIEQGTHKELLKKDGAYAELYYSQFA